MTLIRIRFYKQRLPRFPKISIYIYIFFSFALSRSREQNVPTNRLRTNTINYNIIYHIYIFGIRYHTRVRGFKKRVYQNRFEEKKNPIANKNTRLQHRSRITRPFGTACAHT